jgi:hypothetical protein
MDAEEGVGHLADLLRELQQPDLDGNVPRGRRAAGRPGPTSVPPEVRDAAFGGSMLYVGVT